MEIQPMAVIATIGVIVALFKEEIVKLWRRPRLEPHLRTQSPDCQKLTTDRHYDEDGQLLFDEESYCFRLWIANTGTQEAQRVQVFASNLFIKRSDNQLVESPAFVPMYLKWSHTSSIYSESIPPKMGRHCDLGTMHEPDPFERCGICPNPPIDPNQPTNFVLSVEVPPVDRSHILNPGDYHLEILVVASNCKPTKATVAFNFNGRWSGDFQNMFANNMSITLLRH